MPGRALLGWLRRWIVIPMSDLSAGAASPVLDIGEHKAGVSICYEAALSGLIADAMPAAHYFINLSNDAWFGVGAAAEQHLQMARVRAAEFGRPMLRATTTGISAIIDHRGRLLRRTRQRSRESLAASVQPRQGLTPYAAWGDWPAALAVLLSFAAFARHRRRRGRPSEPPKMSPNKSSDTP